MIFFTPGHVSDGGLHSPINLGLFTGIKIPIMKKSVLLAMAGLSLFLVNCSGSGGSDPNPQDCNLDPAVITTNSPVTAGEDIQLQTPYVNNGIYHWTGPNGFSSYEQNPVIHLASQQKAGTYSLTVGNELDDCVTPPATTVVAVVDPVAPCSPANNTATNSVYPAMSFYYVLGSVVQDQYQITANGSQGDLTLIFKDQNIPTAGVYHICPDCPTSFLEANQVCMSIVTGGTFSDYFRPSSGDVYVSFVNGHISATFCSLAFSGTGVGVNFTASGKVTDNQ